MNSLRSAASHFLAGIVVGGAFLTGCAVSVIAIDAVLLAAFPDGRFQIHPASILDSIRERPRRSRKSSGRTSRSRPLGPSPATGNRRSHRSRGAPAGRRVSLGRGDCHRLDREPHRSHVPIRDEVAENPVKFADPNEKPVNVSKPASRQLVPTLLLKHKQHQLHHHGHSKSSRHKHGSIELKIHDSLNELKELLRKGCSNTFAANKSESIQCDKLNSDSGICEIKTPSILVRKDCDENQHLVCSAGKLKKILRFKTEKPDRAQFQVRANHHQKPCLTSLASAEDNKQSEKLRKRLQICIDRRKTACKSANPSKVIISPPASRTPSLHAVRYRLRHISSCVKADPMRFQSLRKTYETKATYS